MKITLKQSLLLMKKINESKDFTSYFSNGKMVIESKIIQIGGYNGNGN